MSCTKACTLAFTLFSLLFSGVCTAADKVVVVPIGGARGDAVAGDVLDGKTFSNAKAKGIAGTRPPAPVAKTGATTMSYPGDDGWYADRVGVSLANRFAVIFMGGQLDLLTGLEWEPSPPNTMTHWIDTLNRCEGLGEGPLGGFIFQDDDWRLPNINELFSLINHGTGNPALPAGSGISLPVANGNGWFWTSTTYANSPTYAWRIHFGFGAVDYAQKINPATFSYSICVRGQMKTP